MTHTLSDRDVALASRIAEARNRFHGRPGRVSIDPLQAHLQGATAELAFARVRNLPWDGMLCPDKKSFDAWARSGHDVCGYQVKATVRSDGGLLFKSDDSARNEQPAVLGVVSRDGRTVRFVGWAWGHEVRAKRNWNERLPRPGYLMSQSLLRSIDSLPVLGRDGFVDREPRDWLVVDGSNGVMRSFYGAGRREPLPSILWAVHDVERCAESFGITDVAWCFDRRPYLRNEIYPDYKKRRSERKVDEEEQAALDDLRARTAKLHTHYLPELGYQNVFVKTGYEADDLMASLVKNLPGGDRAILLSGDHDLYQLLCANCAVYHPIGDQFVTADSFRREWRVEPSEWAKVKAIAGCKTDEVPGVDGVAELTAIKYLTKRLPETHVTSWNVFRFLKTAEYERNLKLTTLPFAGCPVLELAHDPERRPLGWRRLCEKLEMQSLADSVEAGRKTLGSVLNG